MSKDSKKGNFKYADSKEEAEETVEDTSTISGQVPDETDVDNTEYVGVKAVEQGQSSTGDNRSGSFPADSRASFKGVKR